MVSNGSSKPGAAGEPFSYISGFGNHVETEAVAGALPVGQNSPQVPPYGLFAEQLSGTAFTVPRVSNQRTWMYRLEPAVKYGPAKLRAHPHLMSDFTAATVIPDQLRWKPIDMPSPTHAAVDWVDGLCTMCGAGGPDLKDGVAIHLYACNAPMASASRAFTDADGDLLIVPQHGALRITTELGKLRVMPGEICVVPRNIIFAVDPEDNEDPRCRGYVLETFSGAHFVPPDRGPIGANSMAETRDFLIPTAWYEDRPGEWVVTSKVLGRLFDRTKRHSPFDVVAWHGNYAPFKYDLSRFHTVNTVSVDHPDPSIFTVLTIPSSDPGVALVDFVIFPPRWMAAENTFRPPYYHRNCMSEFMGLIDGSYDAKRGFLPGGSSLHGIGTAHGPDAPTFRAASAVDTSTPTKFDAGTAFMFETRAPLKLAPFAADTEGPIFDGDYMACWDELPRASVTVHQLPNSAPKNGTE
mmetsp:Transcript_4345/g.12708  ORF Transcript_4345/g.12708 Transcript_4345/m.12708 type:complete len:466 (-) Transcript_4345:97-1494(-)